MSMLGISFLNEIVSKREITKPSQVLNELRIQVKNSLNQSGQKGDTHDGMDISLCVINTNNLELQFAGAYNPLLIIRLKDLSEVEIIEIKADRMPIGMHPKDNISFISTEFQLQKNDIFYIFSDGYHSQFGGIKNEKIKTCRFKDLLAENCKLPLKEQKQILENEFNNWKGKNEQTDDVLVIGIKI